MKFVKILPYTVGFVYRKETFLRALTEGTYFIKPSESLRFYDMSKEFSCTTELEILLKDEAIKELLEVINIEDDQVGLYYEDKNFKKVLTPGRYVFWKNIKKYNIEIVEVERL